MVGAGTCIGARIYFITEGTASFFWSQSERFEKFCSLIVYGVRCFSSLTSADDCLIRLCTRRPYSIEIAGSCMRTWQLSRQHTCLPQLPLLTAWIIAEFWHGSTFEEGQVHWSPMSGQLPRLILQQQITSFTCRSSLNHSPVHVFFPHIEEFL